MEEGLDWVRELNDVQQDMWTGACRQAAIGKWTYQSYDSDLALHTILVTT